MEYVIAGNIGGTNTQIALVDNNLNIIKEQSFLTNDINNNNKLDEILVNFIRENSQGIEIKKCVLGCAGPLLFNKEKCKLSNSALCIETEGLAKTKEKCKDIRLLNDMEAFAYGFSALDSGSEKIIDLHGKVNNDKILILMPGTGFGVVFLFKGSDNNYNVLSSEFNENYINIGRKEDIELFNFFTENNIDFKYDNIVSGPGIMNLYGFFKGNSLNSPEEIVKKALSDYNTDNNSAELGTVKSFVYYLAKSSASLSLSLMPKTIILAGNIMDSVHDIIKEEFMDNFRNFFSGNYSGFREMNVSLLKPDNDLFLKGCAYFGFKNS